MLYKRHVLAGLIYIFMNDTFSLDELKNHKLYLKYDKDQKYIKVHLTFCFCFVNP